MEKKSGDAAGGQIRAAQRGGVVQKSSAQQVIVNSAVMPVAIAHPTESRLLDKSRQHLVKAAEDNRMRLPPELQPVAPRLAVGRYSHAKQSHEEGCVHAAPPGLARYTARCTPNCPYRLR